MSHFPPCEAEKWDILSLAGQSTTTGRNRKSNADSRISHMFQNTVRKVLEVRHLAAPFRQNIVRNSLAEAVERENRLQSIAFDRLRLLSDAPKTTSAAQRLGVFWMGGKPKV